MFEHLFHDLVLKLILFQLLIVRIFADPIRINSDNDYQVLNQFFRVMFAQSEYGYVLDGSKPASQMNISSLGNLIAPQSSNFQTEVLAREAIPVWKKLLPVQKNFVLKISEINDESFLTSSYELVFINVQKLKETIQSNIDLFRYVLGPTINAEQLTEYIIRSQEPLDVILRDDKVLTGIVLGYGSYNSLMHSRAEEIQNAQVVNDIPPFHPHSNLMNQKGVAQWNDMQIKTLFLAHAGFAEGSSKITEKKILTPGLGFTKTEDELSHILTFHENIADTLASEKPRFIFGAYKNNENQQLMKSLSNSQKKIQSSLARQDFLESILEKITGEMPIIRETAKVAKNNHMPLNANAEIEVVHALWQMVSHLDPETVPEFIDAFCLGDRSEIKREPASVTPGSIGGLKRALSNLQFVETWFSTIPQEKSLKEILPGYLYFEQTKVGEGKILDSHDRLLVSYVIEDGYGNVLSANHRYWIKLSDTIPGFAQGVQGMQEGESRTLYIHPALAYGAFTTLPPCLLLCVKVTVHEIPEQPKALPYALIPIDLSWIKESNFYQKVEQGNYQIAKTLGSRWGSWIKQSIDLDFSNVCTHLKRICNENGPSYSTLKVIKDNRGCCNRVFWNLIIDPNT
jgi:hypothetical protein